VEIRPFLNVKRIPCHGGVYRPGVEQPVRPKKKNRTDNRTVSRSIRNSYLFRLFVTRVLRRLRDGPRDRFLTCRNDTRVVAVRRSMAPETIRVRAPNTVNRRVAVSRTKIGQRTTRVDRVRNNRVHRPDLG